MGILGTCAILTGCSAFAPTYGTGQAVSVQFFRDIADMALLKPKNNHIQPVVKPRKQLVLPRLDGHIKLPQPQQNVTQYSLPVDKISGVKALS
ncbi:hypothetical protein [Bartonella sp. CB189]|uniref:hypothetical protein n=1 Tax=Bartonella sp. CB189 TaxID=3112254 RepID=UPI002F96319F